MIFEKHMGIGTWDVQLRRDTPGSVLDRLSFFGHIVITPAWLSPQSFSDHTELLGFSLFTAPKFQHAGRRVRLGGYGPAVWLGMNSGGFSRLNTGATATSTQTFQTHLRTWVLTESGDQLNGITEGSVFSGGAGFKVTRNSHRDTPLAILNYICEYSELEWRINPDFTLDARAASTFWPDPAAVLTPWWGGRDLGQVGYLTSFDVAEDCDGYANGIAAEASDGNITSGDYSFFETVYGLDGNTIERMEDLGSAANAEDLAEASAYIAALESQGYLFQTRKQARVRLVDAHAPRTELEPGCTVAVYDPTQDLYDLATDSIHYRGHVVYPAHLRVKAMNWPVQQGMGVWFIDSTSDLSVLDLTPYVEWESGDTTLDVGATSRTLNDALGRAA